MHNTKFYLSKWNEAKKRKWLMAGFKFLPSFPDLFVEIWFFLLPFALCRSISLHRSLAGWLVCSFVIIFENLIMFKLHKIWSAYFFPFVYCWLSSILLLLLWLMKMSMNCSGESEQSEREREREQLCGYWLDADNTQGVCVVVCIGNQRREMCVQKRERRVMATRLGVRESLPFSWISMGTHLNKFLLIVTVYRVDFDMKNWWNQ